jgi:hypothetical protein
VSFSGCRQKSRSSHGSFVTKGRKDVRTKLLSEGFLRRSCRDALVLVPAWSSTDSTDTPARRHLVVRAERRANGVGANDTADLSGRECECER